MAGRFDEMIYLTRRNLFSGFHCKHNVSKNPITPSQTLYFSHNRMDIWSHYFNKYYCKVNKYYFEIWC